MDIDSPPFPKTSTNPRQLFEYLFELHDWVTSQIDWANMEASRLNAPDQPFISPIGYPANNPDRYTNLAVVDMFVSWQSLRSVRKKYDSIVRNYEEEEAWNSDPCIFHRINIVKIAATLLSLAFLDREKREAKEYEMLRSHRKHMLETLKKAFGDIGGLLQGDDEDDDEIDFDSLFNPPDEE